MALRWYGHVNMRPDKFMQTVIPGMVDGGRGRGCARKQWMGNAKNWKGLSVTMGEREAREARER